MFGVVILCNSFLEFTFIIDCSRNAVNYEVIVNDLPDNAVRETSPLVTVQSAHPISITC
jgi:hypothetical protein